MTDNHSATPGGQGRQGPDASAVIAAGTSVPHSAQVWNYWLGGKDNYAVDRAADDEYVKVYPGIVDVAGAGRSFIAPCRALPGR